MARPRPKKDPRDQRRQERETVSYRDSQDASSFISIENVHLTQAQAQFFEKIKNGTIIFCHGPAGTAKTYTACYAALWLLSKGHAERIVLTKPIEEAGEKLGFLPGEIDEKISPYYASYVGNMSKMIGSRTLGYLISEKKIVQEVSAYMRGVTYDNCIMLVDEAQNFDFRQLVLITTRLGANSKIVIMGDTTQYDIEQKTVALPDFIEMCDGIEHVNSHEFTSADIVRNPILIEITDRYEKLKSEGKVTQSKRR